MMIKHGIDSMPGGGAEIFDEKVRKKFVVEKLLEQWLEIHNFGIKKEENQMQLCFWTCRRSKS